MTFKKVHPKRSRRKDRPSAGLKAVLTKTERRWHCRLSVDAIAGHANLNKADAGRGLDGIVSAIQNDLKNDDFVSLVGFGRFEVKERAERIGRNPQTGAELTIAAAKIPGFNPGKALKDAVNG